ncbi:MAG: hypothetical protein NVSMB31_01000 [Vulcanimicrobiaceae bacterium]
MSLEVRLGLLSLVFFAAFLTLGWLVTTRRLSRFDIRAENFHGMSTDLAVLFTLSGRSLPLLSLGVFSTLIFAVLHKPIWIPLAIFVSQVSSQGVAELFKRVFVRVRPEKWLVRLEHGFSFPSGHATTAIVFYGAWLLTVMLTPMPHFIQFLVATLLLVWMAGIDWSRMALSAHYFSDILGGTLFGSAWICGLSALLVRFHLSLPGMH